MDGTKVLMTSKMFKTAKSEKFHLKIGHSWNDLQWDQDLPKKPQAPPPPAAINSLSKTIVQSLWNLTDEDLTKSADLFFRNGGLLWPSFNKALNVKFSSSYKWKFQLLSLSES